MTSINFSTLFTNPLHGAAIQKNFEINGTKIQTFQFNDAEIRQDNFTSNPLYINFKGKAEIEQTAKSNPRITELCKKYNIPIKANIEELEALKHGHLQNTRVLAAKICSNMK